MQSSKEQTISSAACNKEVNDLFIVLCASGFEDISKARSALMFSSLASAANYRAILYCIQNAVDIMIKGTVEKYEISQPGAPTLAQRLNEALEIGVEIQCCSQTMANKKLTQQDLIPGVTVAGAMNLITLATKAKGTICF